jgi:hypothetical protein
LFTVAVFSIDVAEWVLNEYALVNEDRVISNDDPDCEIKNGRIKGSCQSRVHIKCAPVFMHILFYADNQHKDTLQKIVERHKFELLEDFHPPRGASDNLRMEMQEFSTTGPGNAGDWMQQNYSTEAHPVNLMVQQ